jgi:hypothetical protein
MPRSPQPCIAPFSPNIPTPSLFLRSSFTSARRSFQFADREGDHDSFQLARRRERSAVVLLNFLVMSLNVCVCVCLCVCPGNSSSNIPNTQLSALSGPGSTFTYRPQLDQANTTIYYICDLSGHTFTGQTELKTRGILSLRSASTS